MKVLTLIGGISKGSINKKLFELIKPLAPQDMELEVFDIASLPFYSQDIENEMPAAAADMKNKISSYDAVLIITPEYNRSMPGVLKNAIDFASRPPGKSVWIGKPVATLGASGGAIGTYAAQMQVKSTLSFLGALVMWQPEIYFNFTANVNENGELAETSKKFFGKFLESFKNWIEKQS